MAGTRSAMKMPELLVFARVFAIGIVGAEIFRLAFYSGSRFALALGDVGITVKFAAVALVGLICVIYALRRDGFDTVSRLARSLRIDLLITLVLGASADRLVAPWLSKVHRVAMASDQRWAPTIVCVALVLMLSAIVRASWPKKAAAPQLRFLGDDDICHEDDDVLDTRTQAKNFAETVLASGSHAGLVFGIDAPWGAGKTSFVNLAQQHWQAASDQVIVLRFEPLRYASDPDLADRLIRDLSAEIQKNLYAPEFQPAASRYSRMLKGKADFSFLGFKLSFEPSSETVDELLRDIDDVLIREDRRVIIVVDDLDRLEPKAVNNVLFAARRTFQLSQASYILCYDTENLASAKDEGERAREFLEKFVNVKLSLFVDPLSIRNFLRSGWKTDEARFPSIPSDTMAKLESVLSELANMLGDDTAARYMPLIGDLRKVKRFVNAVLLMQIEKTDLAKTDFNRRDLVHLILLHLKYPGRFRQIYAEETEERSGTFSAKRIHDSGTSKFGNSDEFVAMMKDYNGGDRFLLEQLFDVSVLGLEAASDVDESTLTSRACFNSPPHRNLQKYLKLIVRFEAPEPRETFRLYQETVDRLTRGDETIKTALSQSSFDLTRGEYAHDQFWRVLINQSYDFTQSVADDAIDTLVEWIPRYSMIDFESVRGMRSRSVYSLIQLLDRAGWGRTQANRRANTPENIVEIARRIYGEAEHKGKGLIDRLAAPARGVLGWDDLMLFRLQCSADRGGQVFNVHNALVLHEDMAGPTSGLTSTIALIGMRVLSQQVFLRFKKTYIDQKVNFLTEVSKVDDASFLGFAEAFLKSEISKHDSSGSRLNDLIEAARSTVKGFVLYQLANAGQPNGTGVGCGFYDEEGAGDAGGISAAMNKYVFDFCFNPDVEEGNMYLFADHCLAHLTSGFFAHGNESGYIPTGQGLLSGFDADSMKQYWQKHGAKIKAKGLAEMNRRVVTPNYVATYREDLGKVFIVLDNLRAGPPSALANPT